MASDELISAAETYLQALRKENGNLIIEIAETRKELNNVHEHVLEEVQILKKRDELFEEWTKEIHFLKQEAKDSGFGSDDVYCRKRLVWRKEYGLRYIRILLIASKMINYGIAGKSDCIKVMRDMVEYIVNEKINILPTREELEEAKSDPGSSSGGSRAKRGIIH